MADYIDNNTMPDDNNLVLGGFSINLNDDLDAPLLEEQINGTINITPCLCGMPGFQHSATLLNDHHNNKKAKRQLITATSLCFVFMIAELIGGYMAGSLAIMTDAAHLLTDCISFIVALLAIWLSRKPADHRMSFGYKRAEILGAILSILGIWLLTAFLLYLAVNRLINNDFDIHADTMIIVSGIGIFINIIMGYILHGSCNISHGHSHGGQHGHSHSPKMKSIPLNNDVINNHNNINQSQPAFVINNNNNVNSNNINNNNNNNNIVNSHNNNNNNINNIMGRNNSICSYRSPSHSRTNSFSSGTDQQHHGRRSGSNASLIQIKLKEAAINRVNTVVSGNSSRILLDTDCHPPYRDVPSDNDLFLNNNNHNHNHNNTNQNINIQAAVIHVLGDFIQSIGVFIASVIIKFYPEAKIADPICTFIFSILVMFTTFRIIKESIMIILDAVPSKIDYTKLITEFGCITGVISVHHLNVWNLTIDWPILTVHLIVDQFSNADKILHIANNIAKNKFNIKHATIQIEKNLEILDVHNSTELTELI